MKRNNFKKSSFRGRIYTKEDTVNMKYPDYSYVADVTKVKYKVFVNEVNEIARTSYLPMRVIRGVVTAKYEFILN